MPRFSIIITCYNQASFIRDAVNSALAQSFAGKEVILVDDCSTDGSGNVLMEYGDAIKFKALETNQGAGNARNWGASLASGDFLIFLDGDDLLLPWALEVYTRIIDLKDPKLILGRMLWFQGAFSSVNVGGLQKEIGVVDYEAFMKKDRSWRASASALVIDRRSFNEAGRWTQKLFPIEDQDLVLMLGYSGRTIQIVSPKTTAYRMHATNATQQIQKLIDGILQIIRREKSGQYPGGSACRFERYAVVGGLAFYWMKTAFNTKLYRKGILILSAGWLMILAAVFRRCASFFAGKRPVEKLGLVS